MQKFIKGTILHFGFKINSVKMKRKYKIGQPVDCNELHMIDAFLSESLFWLQINVIIIAMESEWSG